MISLKLFLTSSISNKSTVSPSGAQKITRREHAKITMIAAHKVKFVQIGFRKGLPTLKTMMMKMYWIRDT